MLIVLRNRNYAFLWFGQLVSVFGDWMLTIALPFAVYDLTGSTLATGVMFMAQTLPRIVFASVAGVLVDRWNRRRTMIVIDLVRGMTLLALLLVHSSDTIWVIYLVAFTNAAVGQLFLPAKNAVIPRLVTGAQLTAANALNSLSENATRLIAPALGGALYALYGLRLAAGVDAASFVVSAVCLICLAASVGTPEVANTIVPLSIAAVWHEWREGMRFARTSAVVRAVFVSVGIVSISEGIVTVALVPFTRQVLGGGAATLGLIISAQAIGGIIGSVIFGRVGDRLPPALTVGISGATDAVLLFAIFNLPGRVPISPVALAVVLIAIAGAAVIGFFVFQNALLQRAVPDAYRGRVFGVYYTVQAALMLCGQGMVSLLTDRLGIVSTISLGPVMEMIGGALAFILLRRAFTQPPSAVSEPQKTATTAALTRPSD